MTQSRFRPTPGEPDLFGAKRKKKPSTVTVGITGAPPKRPTVVLGIDGAWGGLGWAVATKAGPRYAGWSNPGAKVDRLDAIAGIVHESLGHARAVAGAIDGTVLRVAVEKPPEVYRGRGNQFATGYGLGTCAGTLLAVAGMALQGQRAAGAVKPDRGELVPVAEWRAWWHPLVHGPGTDAWKATAVAAVRTLGWGHLLPTGDRLTDIARRGDVAEAILLAVGRARHAREEGE